MKIQIKVTPRAEKEEIISDADGRIIVRVKERAEKGKANAAVLRALVRHFGKKVRITSGFSGRRKIVEIL